MDIEYPKKSHGKCRACEEDSSLPIHQECGAKMNKIMGCKRKKAHKTLSEKSINYFSSIQ